MGGGLRLGRFRGTPIVLYPTGIILVLLFAWITSQYFSGRIPGGLVAAVSIGTGIGVLISILLHELGHTVAARAFKIHTTEVSLYGLGGMARLASLPATPTSDVVISAAGPAMSLALGAVLYYGLQAVVNGEVLIGLPLWARVAVVGLWQLGRWNLAIGILNLVPGPPLDGGGIVRGIGWAVTRSRTKGLRVSGYVGVASLALGVLALVGRQVPPGYEFTVIFVMLIVGMGSIPLVRGELPSEQQMQAAVSRQAAGPAQRGMPAATQEIAETAARAKDLAVQLGADVVTATHLLLAVLAYRLSLTSQVLGHSGVDFDALWQLAARAPATMAGSALPVPADPPFSVPVRQMVQAATKAGQGRDGLMLALPEGSEASVQLRSLGVDVATAKSDLAAAIAHRAASA